MLGRYSARLETLKERAFGCLASIPDRILKAGCPCLHSYPFISQLLVRRSGPTVVSPLNIP